MKKQEIKIEVVSDVVCPWCYIGKRRLEKAMDQLKEQYNFDVSYSPFELNPTLPPEGVDQKTYLIEKFGSEERYRQITQQVTHAAAGEGLKFDFSKQHTSPNTRDAHRIISYAKQEGKQAATKEAFLKAYFEDGIDLSRRANLLLIATHVGLRAENVKSMLDSDEGVEEVVLKEGLNRQRGVSGVPFYIINNKYGLYGAQPAETFIKVLTEIGTEVLKGEVCDLDDKNC